MQITRNFDLLMNSANNFPRQKVEESKQWEGLKPSTKPKQKQEGPKQWEGLKPSSNQ